MNDELYYRIQVTREGTLAICELQRFDESDYDEKRWFTTSTFKSPQEAYDWLVRVYGASIISAFDERPKPSVDLNENS